MAPRASSSRSRFLHVRHSARKRKAPSSEQAPVPPSAWRWQSSPTPAPESRMAVDLARPRRTERGVARQQANQLLRALSAADYALLVPHLRRVTLSAGDIISKPHARPRHAYFPETAVLSLIIVMENGAAVEAATVGNEGLVGLSALLGDGAMSSQCLAQIAGDAQRLPMAALAAAVAK